MSDQKLEVIGLGNAIVDVLAKCDDAFLQKHDIVKGGMTLIDEERAHEIYSAMASATEISGGAAANSIACVASLKGAGGFIGKVADDQLGEIFRHDLKATGVEFTTAPLVGGPSTARSLINVTPDAQRSMSTYLGAANHITEEDIDPAQIARGEISFFEGYLFQVPSARAAFARVCEIAHQNGKRTAMTLSDSFCVNENYDDMVAFIDAHIDIVLANEAEAEALYRTAVGPDMAERAQKLSAITAVTRSEKGSVIYARDHEPVEVSAHAPGQLEDTTGAGDAYAGGFLLGLARGYNYAKAGALGSLAAAEIISHIGARPNQLLFELATAENLM